jgi:hypothetical protein
LASARWLPVIPYAFCALASGLVAAHASGGGLILRPTLVEIIAFVFAVFTLYGCGAEPVLYGLLLLVLGITVFVCGSTVGECSPRRERPCWGCRGPSLPSELDSRRARAMESVRSYHSVKPGSAFSRNSIRARSSGFLLAK